MGQGNGGGDHERIEADWKLKASVARYDEMHMKAAVCRWRVARLCFLCASRLGSMVRGCCGPWVSMAHAGL